MALAKALLSLFSHTKRILSRAYQPEQRQTVDPGLPGPGAAACSARNRSVEADRTVVPDDFRFDPRLLLAEDDQSVRRRLAGARDEQAVGAEEGAGFGDLLRAGIFPLPLQVAEPAVPRGLHADGGKRLQIGKPHDRFERDPQFVQLVAHPGRRDRLAAIEMEAPFGDRRVPALRRVEDVQAAVVPAAARAPARQGIAALADRAPHRSGPGRLGDGLQGVEKPPVAYPAYPAPGPDPGPEAVPARHVQR